MGCRWIDSRTRNGDYEPGNVRWASDEEQAQNQRSTKLRKSDVIEILRRLERKETAVSIAHRFGVTPSMVSQIRVGRTWKNVPRRLL